MRKLLSLGIVVVFIFVSCGGSSQERGSRFKKEGDELYLEKKYSQAIDKFKKAIELSPNDAKLLKKIGDAYLHLADRQSALEAYEGALLLNPYGKKILLCIGKIHLMQLDIKSAVKVWEQLKLRPHQDSNVYIFHGDLLVLKHDLYSAEKAFRKALSIDANNLKGLIKLSICLLVQGKNEDASEIYDQLEALRPKDTSILVQMANYQKLRRDYQRAEELYLQAMEIDPENPYHRLALAEFYYDMEEYSMAISTLEEMEGRGVILPSYKILQVESLLNLGDLMEAKSCLEELSKIQPNDIEVEFLKGKYNLMASNPAIAISNFLFVLNKEPNMVQAHYLLGLAYFAAGHNRSGHQSLTRALSINNMYTDAELVLADFYYKQFKYDLALEHISRIVEREPENYRAQIIMGNILLAQEKTDSAIICFYKAHMIQPEEVSPIYFTAIASEKSGSGEKAMNLYKSIMEKKPNLIDVSTRYVELLIKSGKAEKAKKLLMVWLKEGTDDSVFINYLLGKVCLALGDLESAKSYFEASVAENHVNSVAYIELAKVYKNENDIDKYINAMQSAIRDNNQLTSAYVELASYYLNIGNAQKAIQTLREGIITNPDDPLLKNNLAVLYLNEDENINKAFELAQSAYQELSNKPSVNDTLGWAYYKKGLYRQAEWYIKEAIRLGNLEAEWTKNGNVRNLDTSVADEHEGEEVHKPKIMVEEKKAKNLAIVQYHLGMVLKDKGDDVGAKTSLEKALKVGLEGEFRRDAERILGIVGKDKEDVENLMNEL
jgi:tetratricopeptide (TPR) repeat protein